MSNVIQFKPGTVSVLWAPTKKCNAAWRVGAASTVVDASERFKPTPKPEMEAVRAPVKTVNIVYKRTEDSDMVAEIRHEIDRISEQYDDDFCEHRLDDYADCIADADDIIRNFKSNYSSRSIGIKEHDDLNADEILERLQRRLTKKQIVALLLDCSNPETCDIYVHWNEIASVQIGEMEYQIDVEYHEDLKNLIAQATDDEIEQAGADRDSFLVYGYPCDRIIWKLDPETLLERLVELEGARA